MRSQNDSPSDTATAGQTVPPVGIPRDVHRIKPFFNSRKRRRNLFLFCLFAGPGLLWFALLMLWPLINMFQVSLLDWWGIVRPSTFVGIDNYLQLLSDQRFHAALSHTLLQLVVVPTMVMPLSFMMGYFLSNRYPGYRLFRVIFFVPVILSVSARAMMFTGIYAPNGIINSFLTTVGLEFMTRVWLGNITTVLPALFAVDIWGGDRI